MAKPTKTQPTPDPIPPNEPPPPDFALRRHAEAVESLTFDTLMRALDADVDIKVSVGLSSVETYQGAVISCPHEAGAMMDTTPLEFAAQAGLLMAAARAAQAVGCGADAS